MSSSRSRLSHLTDEFFGEKKTFTSSSSSFVSSLDHSTSFQEGNRWSLQNFPKQCCSERQKQPPTAPSVQVATGWYRMIPVHPIYHMPIICQFISIAISLLDLSQYHSPRRHLHRGLCSHRNTWFEDLSAAARAGTHRPPHGGGRAVAFWGPGCF